MTSAELTLPAGLWRDGARRRRAQLEWPNEEGERALFESTDGLLPARRVTELLASCASLEGEPGGRESARNAARELCAGDRAAIVLALRRLGFGDALTCVLTCPWTDCGARLELELTVEQLLLPTADEELPTVLGLDAPGGRVRFRLPTGADEERVAERALADPGAAVAELLDACLVDAPEPRPSELGALVGAAMAASDPQAEIELAMICPECERPGRASLDPGAYLFAELAARVARLERDVHLLA